MILVAIFVVGYIAIVLEHPLRVNKAASALLMGVVLWTAHIVVGDHHAILEHLGHHTSSIAQIVFFLLGAMTIVELIDAHDGFELVTSRITTRSRRKLFAVLAALSFVLSAVLDNLTTSIVMMSVARKLASDDADRRYLGGIVIIAANAGGVWSPIGDVTTTMLWIGGQITTGSIVSSLIVPAIVSIVVPVGWLMLRHGGEVERASVDDKTMITTPFERRTIFFVGVLALCSVPVFKTLTGLPPFMGILLGLAVLWIVTELIHDRGDTRAPLSVAAALQRIDSQSVLFFVGILLAITALEDAGLLRALADHLTETIGNIHAITMSIGVASSIIDNVPLVAAAQGMYPLSTYPVDHEFWTFLAFCAGTGGSILIIGSAPGIAVMGIQQITFGWYVRRFSLLALAGFLAGAATFLLMP